jgi:hypothetical protein
MRPNDARTAEWSYPRERVMLEEVGLFEIEVYIQRHRETVFNFVKDWGISQECAELGSNILI